MNNDKIVKTLMEKLKVNASNYSYRKIKAYDYEASESFHYVLCIKEVLELFDYVVDIKFNTIKNINIIEKVDIAKKVEITETIYEYKE